jgi:hypothetical protein
MATLKSLMATVTSDVNIDFRNNDKASPDGTLWGNAWVTNKEGKLLCIAATLETLQKIAADPKMDCLMLTKPEPKVSPSKGLEYDMCQLYIINKKSITEPNNNNKLLDNFEANNIEKKISLKLNQWQKNIFAAIENEGSFDLKMLKIIIENDETGIEFMQHIAYHKKTYEYLSGLNLVNTGFCPITNEKIDTTFNYSIFGRTIYLSENALKLGNEKKQQFKADFQKAHPNFDTNLKHAKAFLDNENTNTQLPKYNNIIYFIEFFLSGYLSHKIVNPTSIYGYIGVFMLFGVIFSTVDWLRNNIINS